MFKFPNLDDFGCKTIKEEQTEELPCEKYPIISNGRRFKKDSRKWLHKSTNKNEPDEGLETTEKPIEAIVKRNDVPDSCNGTNHRKSVSFLKSFLEMDYPKDTQTKPIKCCIRNVEENAHGPEMFRRKNKRRLVSPSTGKQHIARFNDSVENKLRHFIQMSHSFRPVSQSEYSSCHSTNGESNGGVSNFSDAEYTGTNTITNLAWNSEDNSIWRHGKFVLSDGSTTTPASESLAPPCIPIKRSKTHEIITEYSDNSRSSWDSTPSVHDSFSELDITPCGSPWTSLSLEDSILLNCSVESSKETATSSKNKSK
ncbi:uncharacterized protein LOC127735137 [Mytilus californianus]|uniref:uncharacterized protein LOC127735137 n=1 Tax=Mytilus californianus TaxID=6549 RepID=UPI0022462978|nr:uncharacterized protein LOC127735137 [Mytilus californianus]